jgi:hypothetical protein
MVERHFDWKNPRYHNIFCIQHPCQNYVISDEEVYREEIIEKAVEEGWEKIVGLASDIDNNKRVEYYVQCPDHKGVSRSMTPEEIEEELRK